MVLKSFVVEDDDAFGAKLQPLTRNLITQNLSAEHAFLTARDCLRASGYDAGEARATARLLLDELLQTRSAHLMQPHRALSSDEITRFEAALRRLKNGEPWPHILQRAHFHGLELRVDARALIPRPETELLVDEVLRRLESVASPHVADLGTGSGAISMAILVARPDAAATATDLSLAARALALENAQLCGVAARVQVVAGRENDWAAGLPEHQFDAVISNPPYISTSELADLQPQLAFEPRLALDGGPDGLTAYRLLARQTGVLLRPNGFFACELGANQFEPVRDLFAEDSWKVAPPIYDFANIARVLVATRE